MSTWGILSRRTCTSIKGRGSSCRIFSCRSKSSNHWRWTRGLIFNRTQSAKYSKWSNGHMNTILPGVTVFSGWSRHLNRDAAGYHSSDPGSRDIDEFLDDSDEEERESQDHVLRPGEPHRVFVLQPYVKWGPLKAPLTSSSLLLQESISLVRTLRWPIVDSAIYSTDRPRQKQIFGKGTFRAISERLAELPTLTAVFVSLDRLSSAQQQELEDVWNLKIFDRYSLVLEIFKQHARTREAKLQIALAEIPVHRSRPRMKEKHFDQELSYTSVAGVRRSWRSRLRMKDKHFDQQSGAQQYIGGRGETFLEVRQRLLDEQQMKIKRALKRLSVKRGLLRKEREARQFPVVAVVGYTNAGKTSLIQRLTGDPDMEPRDVLFATLDVTAHRGSLPNGMPVIFLDTVGFISNLPHDLVASFSATLQDVLLSDVIVHIRDISHPDTVSQKANVLRVLDEMGLPDKLAKTIIEVCNKSDRLTDPEPLVEHSNLISATEGTGMDELRTLIQDGVLAVTDTMAATLRIPMNGTHLQWLYKEATVKSQQSLEGDTEHMLVDVVMGSAARAKFKAKFGSDFIYHVDG